MDSLEVSNEKIEFSYNDANKLCAVLQHKEQQIEKKRSWLMGLSTTSIHEGSRSLKMPKSMSKKMMMELYVRSDEVSCEAVVADVEKCFGSFENKACHHVVQNYLELFEAHKVEEYAESPFSFLKQFGSIFGDLNNTALDHVTSLVIDKKVSFQKTRTTMKRIIELNLPNILAESIYDDRISLLNKLSQIFTNPNSFKRTKNLTLCTPISASLCLSVKKILEGLAEIPLQVLIAMSLKLDGTTVKPSFPPDRVGLKREFLLKRVEKRCDKWLAKLQEGVDLPKPFAKALSVILLSRELTEKSSDISSSLFFPFPPEIVTLQREFLKALWSLPKLNPEEMKFLQFVLDPKAQVSMYTFRKSLKRYLTEYLFQCDEIAVPYKLSSALAFVNSKSRCGSITCTKEMRKREAEAVLTVSCHLRRILSQFLPENETREELPDEFSETLESDDDAEKNDFVLSEDPYSSYAQVGTRPSQKISLSDDLVVMSGDSRPDTEAQTDFETSCSDILSRDAGNICKNVLFASHLSEKSLNFQKQYSKQKIVEICDVASLLAHRLIGNFLDKLLQLEGKESDVSKAYLKGKTSGMTEFQETKPAVGEIANVPKEDTRISILLQAIKEEMHSCEKRTDGEV